MLAMPQPLRQDDDDNNSDGTIGSNRELILRLQDRMDRVASAKTRSWWEKYMRNTAEFRGVNLVTIREELFKWYQNEQVGKLAAAQKLDLALAFFAGKYAEDKLAGVLLLEEFILPGKEIGWRVLVSRFAKELFGKRHIADWNVCDWFCVRVLGPLAAQNGRECALAISAWKSSDYIWQARASAVAFANMARYGDRGQIEGLPDIILDSCSSLIKIDERFAKTAAGWVLRELSRSGGGNKDAVVEFIAKNKKHFSKESFDSATRKLEAAERSRLTRL